MPGMIPNLACVSAKKEEEEQTKMSQARQISNPAVTAAPCTAPTMGNEHCSISPTTS